MKKDLVLASNHLLTCDRSRVSADCPFRNEGTDRSKNGARKAHGHEDMFPFPEIVQQDGIRGQACMVSSLSVHARGCEPSDRVRGLTRCESEGGELNAFGERSRSDVLRQLRWGNRRWDDGFPR